MSMPEIVKRLGVEPEIATELREWTEWRGKIPANIPVTMIPTEVLVRVQEALTDMHVRLNFP
jgi:hypothetical protein